MHCYLEKKRKQSISKRILFSGSRIATTEASFGMDEVAESMAMAAPSANFKMSAYEPSSKQSIKVRKEFPETWLFENLKADEKDGKAVFSKNIPDTITSWVVSAFAVDKKTGLVVSENPTKVN